MKSRIAMAFCLIVGGASLLYAHDLFLKLDSYFLHPNTPLTISVLNGTFTSTEGPLVAGRITDISVVSPDGPNSTYLKCQRRPLRLIIQIIIRHLDHVDKFDVPLPWRVEGDQCNFILICPHHLFFDRPATIYVPASPVLRARKLESPRTLHAVVSRLVIPSGDTRLISVIRPATSGPTILVNVPFNTEMLTGVSGWRK